MRKYLHINLNDRTIETEDMSGEALARAGRHYIVKTLLEAAKQSYKEAEGDDAKRVAMALIADLQQRYNIAVEARRRFMGN